MQLTRALSAKAGLRTALHETPGQSFQGDPIRLILSPIRRPTATLPSFFFDLGVSLCCCGLEGSPFIFPTWRPSTVTGFCFDLGVRFFPCGLGVPPSSGSGSSANCSNLVIKVPNRFAPKTIVTRYRLWHCPKRKWVHKIVLCECSYVCHDRLCSHIRKFKKLAYFIPNQQPSFTG